jgi:hypothetical protein
VEANGQPQASVALSPRKKNLSVGLRTDLDILEKRKKQRMNVARYLLDDIKTEQLQLFGHV